jgi:hypothetical protein
MNLISLLFPHILKYIELLYNNKAHNQRLHGGNVIMPSTVGGGGERE